MLSLGLTGLENQVHVSQMRTQVMNRASNHRLPVFNRKESLICGSNAWNNQRAAAFKMYLGLPTFRQLFTLGGYLEQENTKLQATRGRLGHEGGSWRSSPNSLSQISYQPVSSKLNSVQEADIRCQPMNCRTICAGAGRNFLSLWT